MYYSTSVGFLLATETWSIVLVVIAQFIGTLALGIYKREKRELEKGTMYHCTCHNSAVHSYVSSRIIMYINDIPWEEQILLFRFAPGNNVPLYSLS